MLLVITFKKWNSLFHKIDEKKYTIPLTTFFSDKVILKSHGIGDFLSTCIDFVINDKRACKNKIIIEKDAYLKNEDCYTSKKCIGSNITCF